MCPALSGGSTRALKIADTIYSDGAAAVVASERSTITWGLEGWQSLSFPPLPWAPSTYDDLLRQDRLEGERIILNRQIQPTPQATTSTGEIHRDRAPHQPYSPSRSTPPASMQLKASSPSSSTVTCPSDHLRRRGSNEHQGLDRHLYLPLDPPLFSL